MTRGSLRIYLGASPGVGKTFAMLDEGYRRKQRGTDVVVGLVETHGREHTIAQLRDLEIVPRRSIDYRGTTLQEMDVEAILARRPTVALVDEYAHTNVPGSLHEKRWQDVEALLAAGIDVISTVNIQHLESLNDVVTRITGVVQRETVPDHLRVIDRGPGLPPSARTDAIAPFQRLGDSRSGEGVGLGLSIAHGFVQAMGGTLTLDDTPGGGLTVIIALTAVIESAATAGLE